MTTKKNVNAIISPAKEAKMIFDATSNRTRPWSDFGISSASSVNSASLFRIKSSYGDAGELAAIALAFNIGAPIIWTNGPKRLDQLYPPTAARPPF